MTEAPPSVAKCSGVRVDGEPCGSVIVADGGYCYSHDPDKAEERRSARVRGGANSASVVRLRRHFAGPSRLGPIADVLETALTQTHMGGLPPARAQAMASLARAIVAVLEAGELEERLEVLESRLSA